MEIWDAYLRDGTLAGQDLIRGEKIPEGLYYMVVHILVRHTDGDYLLTQRDWRKPNYPGWYEASAGGAVQKGEDALTAAKRELYEETGIAAEELREIGRDVSRDAIIQGYLCVTDCDKDAIRLQEGETMAYRWVSEKEFIDFIHSDQMIASQKRRMHDFFVEMGYE